MIDLFCQYIQTNCKPSTYHVIANSLKYLSREFSGYTLSQIERGMVEQYKTKRKAEGQTRTLADDTVRKYPITDATINRDLSTLKWLYSLMEDYGKIEVNKIRKVPMFKEEGRIRFLTDDEKKALLEACTAPWPLLGVQIALDTGLRHHGVVAMRWTDIDFKERSITRLVKGDKKVRIPLTKRLYDALVAYRGSLTEVSPYLFPSPLKRQEGEPPKHLRVDSNKAFNAALAKAGIKDFTFHDLRHSFASDFLMMTGDMKTIQELLGHSDIKTTMRYAHLLDEHKKKAMEKFEGGIE